jgi:tryptophan synthase beta subunit
MATAILTKRKQPGRFGDYGGRYVPEILMAALGELECAYEKAKRDPKFQRRLDELLKTYAGPHRYSSPAASLKSFAAQRFISSAKTCCTLAPTRSITV